MKASEIVNKVIEKIAKANEALKKIVSGGFPFVMEEVELKANVDTAGIYVHSGNTPVCAVARVGDPLLVLREIEGEIDHVVSSTRTAVERRSKLKAECEKLVAESKAIEVAKAAVAAQNMPVDVLGHCDEATAKAIVAAAQKAVKEANRGLGLAFGRAVDAMGGLKAAKLYVHGYAGGLVVTANGKACMVTRFPKSGSNKTLEKMLTFIASDVAALNENRRRYMAEMEKALLHEEQLHTIAKKLDEASEQLAACK